MMYPNNVSEAMFPQTIHMELPSTIMLPLPLKSITRAVRPVRKGYSASELATAKLMMDMLGRRDDLSHLAREQEWPNNYDQNAVLETVVDRLLAVTAD